jgi:hypothetical protein
MTPILLPAASERTWADRGMEIKTLHHGDHRSLLHTMPTTVAPASIDAIIVPTARPAPYLDHAFALAKQLNTTLVVLCSRAASAAAARRRAATVDLSGLVAIDVVASPFPAQATTALLSKAAHGRLLRHTDTSLKRNVGLALTRLMGWDRVVFLDDDIAVEEPAHLTAAAGLLSTFGLVGLENTGFPDNSVVCHAYRKVGGHQTSFIGGGALAVSSRMVESFFPNIYNEDWFFLLDKWLRPTATAGKANQKPFDPFRDPRRARNEEFGDTLAEGVFWLLDEGLSVLDADASFWRKYLPARRDLIATTMRRVADADAIEPHERDRVTDALRGALARHAFIKPDLCVAYLDAWQQDTVAWGRYIRSLPVIGRVSEALTRLRLRERPLADRDYRVRL